jgi:hypothetical protein
MSVTCFTRGNLDGLSFHPPLADVSRRTRHVLPFRRADWIVSPCLPARRTRKARSANCHQADLRPCTRRIQASYYFRILPIYEVKYDESLFVGLRRGHRRRRSVRGRP